MPKKKCKSAGELETLMLSVAQRVMRQRGLDGKADLDVSLAEDGLGLDSMGRLELLQAVEEEFGVEIPEEYWGTRQLANLRALIKLVSKK